MSTTDSVDWNESGSATEIQRMIEEWQAEGKKGPTLLVIVREMITKPFLDTLSPRSCKLLRRFLIMNDVLIDAELAIHTKPV
jgi:hypothetical protein